MITQICLAGEGAIYPDSVHQCHVSWNWNPVWEIVHPQLKEHIAKESRPMKMSWITFTLFQFYPWLSTLCISYLRYLCTDKHFTRIASKSENRLGFGLMVLPYPTLLQHASYQRNISCYISKIIPTKAYMDPLDDHGLFDFYFLIMWPVPNHDQTDEERNQRTRSDMSFRIGSGPLAKFIVW